VKFPRLLLFVAAALITAALLAGCGGPSKASYEKDMKKISAKAEKDIDKLTSGSQPSAKDIENAQKTLDEAADDVDDIDPPSEVKDLHNDLVKVLHDTADLMGELGPIMELSQKDPSKVTEKEIKKMNSVTEKFGKIQKEMTRITKAYKKKDYNIGFDTE
jgi:hypothetical protein